MLLAIKRQEARLQFWYGGDPATWEAMPSYAKRVYEQQLTGLIAERAVIEAEIAEIPYLKTQHRQKRLDTWMERYRKAYPPRLTEQDKRGLALAEKFNRMLGFR